MSGRNRALGAALFAMGLLWPVFVGAAEPAGSGEARSSAVEIYVDGSPASVERMRVASAETFGRAGIDAVVSASADEALMTGRTKPLARAYVDLRNPLAPRVVVVDAQTERELARRTLEENASLETSIEAATLVLYMVVEALVTSTTSSNGTPPSAANVPDGDASTSAADATTPGSRPRPDRNTAPAGRMPAAAEPAAEAPPTPLLPAPSRPSSPTEVRDVEPVKRNTASSLDLQAGLFLRTTTLDAEHPLAGAGVSLELFGRGGTPELGAMVLGAAHLSASPAAAGARASIETYSFRVLPALRVPFSTVLAAVVGIGGGFDAFAIEARSLGAPASDTTASSAIDGTISALVGVRLRLAERLHASLNAGADFDVSPRTFVAQSGAQRLVLLELGRVRPSLSLGFALGLTAEALRPTAVSAR